MDFENENTGKSGPLRNFEVALLLQGGLETANGSRTALILTNRPHYEQVLWDFVSLS